MEFKKGWTWTICVNNSKLIMCLTPHTHTHPTSACSSPTSTIYIKKEEKTVMDTASGKKNRLRRNVMEESDSQHKWSGPRMRVGRERWNSPASWRGRFKLAYHLIKGDLVFVLTSNYMHYLVGVLLANKKQMSQITRICIYIYISEKSFSRGSTMSEYNNKCVIKTAFQKFLQVICMWSGTPT